MNTGTRTRHVRLAVRVAETAAHEGAFVVFAVAGAMIGYTAGQVLGLHPALCLVLAGPVAVFFAIVGEDTALRALTALRHGRRPAPVVVSIDQSPSDVGGIGTHTAEPPVEPPTDLTDAAARMAHIVEVDGWRAAEREAAFFARTTLDRGRVWLGDATLWQGHRDGGASLHLAPGVRLIWHSASDADHPETFTVAAGGAVTEMPVTTADDLYVLLEQFAFGPHPSGKSDTGTEPISYWQELV
ncbi:hypothetical protein [Embleya sp. NPDC050493]|uniref:hypothetical protein n=1 Tax=Embleya sp. NPDC050493 TaxID=3363989 RepID=UPI0037B40112